MAQENTFCKVIIADSPCFSGDAETVISSLPFGQAEKTRLFSIKNKEYRKSSLSALVCLYELLALIGTDASRDLTILRDKKGKPYFQSLDLFFSISHAEDTVAVALSDAHIGIDLEFIDDRRDFLALSSRFFSPCEHQRIKESNSQRDNFFALWTKKEALSKITGEGLSAICKANALEECYEYSLFSLGKENKRAYLSLCRESGAYMPTPANDFLTKTRYTLYEMQN